MFKMPPITRTIIPPQTGWKEQAYYIIDCTFSPCNPVHRYVFYTGFLIKPDDIPGGYNEIFKTEGKHFSDCHYLKAIALIAQCDENGLLKPMRG